MKFYEFSIGFEESKKQSEEKLVDETIGRVEDSAIKYKKIFKNRFNESENKTYTFISSINAENVEGAIVTSEKDVPISVVQSIINECELSVNLDTLKMEECSSHNIQLLCVQRKHFHKSNYWLFDTYLFRNYNVQL